MLPFEVATLDLRGRVVRLGPAVDEILERHAYPPPVAKLLGEAVVLTVMLGSALKIDGRFILQTQTRRARCACWWSISPRPARCAPVRASTRTRVAQAIAAGEAAAGALLGHGHLAMTIDQGPDMNRYQGLVALEGGSLEDAAHEYFRRSEQIPTRVRLAVAEELRAGQGGASHRWRAGGIMLQFLPQAPERARVADLDPGDAPEGIDAACGRGRRRLGRRPLADRDRRGHRIDRSGAVQRAAGLPAVPRAAACGCSAAARCGRNARARATTVEAMLKSFSQDDRDHMVEDGMISVTCEFCSANYVFAPDEVGAKPS